MNDKLSRTAHKLTEASGSPLAILASVVLMLAWLAWAWALHFNDFSQLVLSSFSAAISFVLMFFAAQLTKQGCEGGEP